MVVPVGADRWGRDVSEGEGKKGRGARAPVGLLPRVRLGRGGPFPFFLSYLLFYFLFSEIQLTFEIILQIGSNQFE